MNVIIRPALPEDSTAIARIAAAAFGHDFDRQHVRHVLGSKANYTFVAESAGTIRGFADSFLTRSALGVLRLELDLLAVDERGRGAGIGARLACHCARLAGTLDADISRALVRTENAAMQSLLRRCGYQQSHQRACLFVTSEFAAASDDSTIPKGNLIMVNTLGYSGIWIEGHLNAEAIRAALAQALENQAQTIGAVVGARESSARRLLADFGFSNVGSYHWWTFMPKGGQS